VSGIKNRVAANSPTVGGATNVNATAVTTVAHNKNRLLPLNKSRTTATTVTKSNQHVAANTKDTTTVKTTAADTPVQTIAAAKDDKSILNKNTIADKLDNKSTTINQSTITAMLHNESSAIPLLPHFTDDTANTLININVNTAFESTAGTINVTCHKSENERMPSLWKCREEYANIPSLRRGALKPPPQIDKSIFESVGAPQQPPPIDKSIFEYSERFGCI
jgi:hypothetical protein